MYVILGCGSVGFNAARLLKSSDEELLIIDRSKKRVEDLRDAGYTAVHGEMEVLSAFKEDFERASAFLLLSSNMEANLAGLKHLKSVFPHKFVVARALDPVSAEAFEKAGADRVITPSDVIARSVLREVRDFEVRRTGSELVRLVKGVKSVAIFLQSNPDPDSLGSGLALKAICEHFGTSATLYYGGAIGHQENRAFVNLLEINLVQVSQRDDVHDIVAAHDLVALVDTFMAGKNNILATDVPVDIVFDHHQVEEGDVKAQFADVRPDIGACSSILTQYLRQLDVPVTPELAVALMYGIRTDTRGFTRGATSADMEAATFLSAYADPELLEKIETPPLSAETVDTLGKAIRNREQYGSFVITSVDFIRDRDTLPQAADFLLRLEGVATVIVFGIVEDVIHISARTTDVRVNLGDALERAFGKQHAGGHAKMAGGQIKLGIFGDVDEKEALLRLARDAVRKQVLNVLGLEDRAAGKGRDEE